MIFGAVAQRAMENLALFVRSDRSPCRARLRSVQDVRDETKGPRPSLSAFRNRQGMSGRESGDPAIKCEGIGNGTPQKKCDMARRIDRSIDLPAGNERFDLRRNPKSFAIVRVIKRLDAERIAREKKLIAPGVPNGEGVHASHPAQHRVAACFIEIKENFGVALRNEPPAALLEFFSQLAIIVNLAIKNNGERFVRVEHRLRASR